MKRCLLLLLPLLIGCAPEPPPHPHLHAFYYGWYANEQIDGRLAHWNHRIMGNDESSPFPGHGDIGANYYPGLGEYSSNDPEVLDAHMKMLRRADVGVLVASWWGPDTFEDRNLPLLLDAAERHGLRVAIHLEPFPGREAATSREALRYLIDAYGSHPGLLRDAEFGGRPFVYVYDSYLTPADD